VDDKDNVADDIAESASTSSVNIDILDKTSEEEDVYKPAFNIDLPPLQDILPTVVPAIVQNKPKRVVNLNEVSLRIPLSVLERLLNISSELMTANTQMSDQIQDLLSNRQSMNERNERIRAMLDELEWAVDRQATSGDKQSQSKLPHADFDALEMDSYNELHSITGLLSESVDDDRQISVALNQQLRELKSHLHGQHRLNRELNNTVLDMRMEPVKILLPRLERIVRETARKTGKKINFVVKGEDLAIDTDVLKGLADPLLHLLRNAIDHGIESAEIRETLEKQTTGQIVLSFMQKGDQVVVSLHDDGAGICVDKLYQKALKTGLVDKDKVLSRDEKLRLILQAGFSSRDHVTDVSGRGVGMDVVHSTLKEISGHIRIQSDENQGTEIQLQVPLTLVAANALLVKVADNIVAIPSAVISQIYYLTKDSAVYKDEQWFVTVQEQELPLHSLAHLLGWSVRTFDVTINQSILILKVQDKHYAVYIDDILHSQEIILKSLKPWMDNVRGVNGVCLLLKGIVVPILDMPILLNTLPALSLSDSQLIQEQQQLEQKHVRKILVVDDSLSNRKALSLMIQPLGYEVLTAVDGSDALQQLENNAIDLVITDLEMPNMNGLEMVEFIRSEPAIQHLPIIMVTSRSTVKHRKLARQAGVDAYLTKPVDHETLSTHINHYFNNNKENPVGANTALN
jgi:chemosensory pili system protein ChpA (sensor histidine kinase/response regulator)